MTYIPTAICTVADPRSIKTAAFCRLPAPDSPSFLLTGGIHQAAIPLTGNRIGRVIDIKNFNYREVLVVADVEIEVDLDSGFRSAFVQEPVGAVLVTDAGTAIIGSDGSSGFDDVFNVFLNDDGNLNIQHKLFGFRKWRVVKRHGDQTIVLAEVESTTNGDRLS